MSKVYLTHRVQSGATTSGESRTESNNNEGVLNIAQIFKIGASPSEGLMSYAGHLLVWGLTPSAEMPSVNSTAPADWAEMIKEYSTFPKSPRLETLH